MGDNSEACPSAVHQLFVGMIQNPSVREDMACVPIVALKPLRAAKATLR